MTRGPLEEIAALAGARLQAQMDAVQMTQEALAHATGWHEGQEGDKQVEGSLSPTRIAAYVQGRNRVTAEAARTFEKLWHVPDVWFMGLVSLKEAQLIALERGLTGKIHGPQLSDAPRVALHAQRRPRRWHRAKVIALHAAATLSLMLSAEYLDDSTVRDCAPYGAFDFLPDSGRIRL